MSFRFEEDTICAISTPIGEGGIGIIKLSGPESLSIARKLFRPKHPLDSDSLQSHRLYYGWITDSATGDPVDEVLLSYLRAPRTYTREDVVEINCHSGYAALNRIMEMVLEAGARLAEPGEFTRRAFLNGRIDLSQAEAIIDVIRSRSQQSLLVATRCLHGDFHDKLLSWRESLLSLQAEMEAHIDFSDDLDGDDSDSASLLMRLETELLMPLGLVLEHYESGRVLREGLTIVLVGKPNVGKSSLLNALLGKDRAIVTPFPGTTRDVIEDTFILSGIQVRILDTAGIRNEPDAIEAMGIERTIRSVADADVVLWLMDQSRPWSIEDDTVYQSVSGSRHVILLNKADLEPALSAEDVRLKYGEASPVVRLSVFNPTDIENLRSFLKDSFLDQPIEAGHSTMIPNLRQKECLKHAIESLKRAGDLLMAQSYGELVSMEIEAARRQLDSILGWEKDDELLDRIFSQFCIGK